ncbi:MAG: hypothetical protein ACLFNN_01645 [Candidatus Paceibacterota bacterium]
MQKGILPLVAILFAIVVLGSTFIISASSDSPEDQSFYQRQNATDTINKHEQEKDTSWAEELDKVIPPEERDRIVNSNDSDLNLTERFAQDIFVKILEKELAKKEDASLEDIDLSDIDREKYSDPLAEFLEKESENFRINKEELITKEDIDIKKNSSREELVNFGNSVGEIILENSPDLEHEVLIFDDLMSNGSRQAEEDLKTIAESRRKMAREITDLAIPEDLAGPHLSFINNTLVGATYLERMAAAREDPLLAIVSNKSYLQNVSTQTEKAMKKIGEVFKEKNIAYDDHEAGVAYTFMNHVNDTEELLDWGPKE